MKTAGYISGAAAAESTRAATNLRAGAGHTGIDETKKGLFGRLLVQLKDTRVGKNSANNAGATWHGKTPWQDTAIPTKCQIQQPDDNQGHEPRWQSFKFSGLFALISLFVVV